jgi:hypothetical protein
VKLFYDGVGGAELKKLEWNSSKHVDNIGAAASEATNFGAAEATNFGEFFI